MCQVNHGFIIHGIWAGQPWHAFSREERRREMTGAARARAMLLLLPWPAPAKKLGGRG